jgi:hypothetical protein
VHSAAGMTKDTSHAAYAQTIDALDPSCLLEVTGGDTGRAAFARTLTEGVGAWFKKVGRNKFQPVEGEPGWYSFSGKFDAFGQPGGTYKGYVNPSEKAGYLNAEGVFRVPF